MRLSSFGAGRDLDGEPGTWLPRGERWVAVGTALAAVAIVASILLSSGRGKTYGAASPVRPPGSTPTTGGALTSSTTTSRPVATTAPKAAPAPTSAAPAAATSSFWRPDAAMVAAMPSQAGLGPGWVVLSPPAVAGGAPSIGHECVADPTTSQAAVSLGAGYSDGSHQGAAWVTLFRSGTTAVTAAEQAFTGSPKVLPCLELFATHDALRYQWLGELDPTNFSTAAAPVAVRGAGDAELLRVSANGAGGSPSASWVFVHQYVGRYEALTIASWCSCSPLAPGTLQHLVDASAASLSAVAAKVP